MTATKPLTERQNLARLFGMWTRKPTNGQRLAVLKAAMTEYEIKARLPVPKQ